MIQEPERAFALSVRLRDDAQTPIRTRLLDADARTARAFAPLPREFAALERMGVPPGPLLAALAEAELVGVTPFDALATSGAIDEATLIEALARGLGVDVVGVADLEGPPISADVFEHAMRSGHLWSQDIEGRPRLMVAARGQAVGALAVKRRGQARDPRIALASPRVFADVAVARAGSALAARAAEGPGAVCPELTVAGGLPRPGPTVRVFLVAAALALAACAVLVDIVGVALLAGAGLLFAALNGFRLWLSVTPSTDPLTPPRIADVDLPVYTVLVALYREGTVAAGLLDALDRLDYPRAKLDVKILTEEADAETFDAVARCSPRSGVEVMSLPKGGPQTNRVLSTPA